MSKATTTTTMRDAYEMGRYVTRHPGSFGAADRKRLAGLWLAAGDARVEAYWLGRNRLARTGEH